MPTAVPERGGRRLPTDANIDLAGEAYSTNAYTLRQTQGPAAPYKTMGPVDAVLVRNDHHFENLVQLGRALLLQTPFTGGEHPAPRPSPLCACEGPEADGVSSPSPLRSLGPVSAPGDGPKAAGRTQGVPVGRGGEPVAPCGVATGRRGVTPVA